MTGLLCAGCWAAADDVDVTPPGTGFPGAESTHDASGTKPAASHAADAGAAAQRRGLAHAAWCSPSPDDRSILEWRGRGREHERVRRTVRILYRRATRAHGPSRPRSPFRNVDVKPPFRGAPRVSGPSTATQPTSYETPVLRTRGLTRINGAAIGRSGCSSASSNSAYVRVPEWSASKKSNSALTRIVPAGREAAAGGAGAALSVGCASPRLLHRSASRQSRHTHIASRRRRRRPSARRRAAP